jgi:predicted NBD/HSP70 family sugar kinase
LRTTYPEMKAKSQAGDMQARGWVDQFAALGRALSVYVE